MKPSVSLPAEDVALVDHYALSADLEDDYADAWDEWEASGEQALWDTTIDQVSTSASVAPSPPRGGTIGVRRQDG